MREVKIQVYYTIQNLILETLNENKVKLRSKVLLFTKQRLSTDDIQILEGNEVKKTSKLGFWSTLFNISVYY